MTSDKGNMATTSLVSCANNDASPPLNFMFLDLAEFQGCLEKEPRFGMRGLTKSTRSGKYKTKSIRFNNNVIENYTNFEDTVSWLLEDPNEIEWVDLSFNLISTIDQALLNYPKLKILYLHGNHIKQLSEIDKLAGLPNLISVSFHGNPIENINGYKNYILSTLPQIQNLDFSTITKGDRDVSYGWQQKFGARFKK